MVLLILVFTLSCSRQSPLEGRWSGEFEINDKTSTIDLEITRVGNDLKGTAKLSWEESLKASDARALSLDAGTMVRWSTGDNVSGLLHEGSKVEFLCFGVRFYGELSEDGTRVTGNLHDPQDDLETFELIKGSDIANTQWAIYQLPMDFAGLLPHACVTWLSVWVAMFIFLPLYFKKRSAKDPGPKHDPAEELDSAWLIRVMPIVRLKRRNVPFARDRGVVLCDDALFIFRKRKKRSITSLHHQTSPEGFLKLKGLKRKKVVPLNSIARLTVERASRLGKVRFRVAVKHEARRMKFELPFFETPGFVRALKAFLGDRLEEDQSISFHRVGNLIGAAAISSLILLPFLIGKFGIQRNPFPSLEQTGLEGVLGGLFLALALVLPVIVGILLVPWVLDHLPARRHAAEKAKQVEDLSHRRPLRSTPAALLIKLLGLAILVLGVFVVEIGTFWTYLLVGNVLMLGHALGQKDPNIATMKDKREPILYLRSFLDDRETTLHPRSWLSFALGVDPPYYLLDSYDLEPGTKLNRSVTLVIRYLYNYHPLRLLRLIIGRPVDTSEQQLGRFLRKYGFFVAIGKPGEKIVTTGAARMYVNNKEWQKTVIALMKESKIVVLQPSRTAGVWWEVEQTLTRVQPQRVLMCLVNYKQHQDDYENFRLRMEELMPGARFPRSLGNENAVSFLAFDSEWTPHTLFISYHFPLTWVILGPVANLKRTLRPFLSGIGSTFTAEHP